MEAHHDAAKVRFFPPGIPLLTILVGAGLQWLWPIDPGFAIPAPGRYFIGGAIIIGAILVLGLWPVIIFRKGGQSENPWKPTPHIETRGPYRFTRNPMYLQMVLVCIGVAIAFSNGWILLLTPVTAWALYALAIRPEEAYLAEKFGEDYLDYKRKVRRWI